jgi:hypothetical protein
MAEKPTLTAMEIKLVMLALDPSAQVGEIQNASIMFFNSLRKRGITSEGFGVTPGPAAKPTAANKPKPKPQQQRSGVTMPFGKHMGKEFHEIDPQYLQWVHNKWIPGLDDAGQKDWQWLATAIEQYFEDAGARL